MSPGDFEALWAGWLGLDHAEAFANAFARSHTAMCRVGRMLGTGRVRLLTVNVAGNIGKRVSLGRGRSQPC